MRRVLTDSLIAVLVLPHELAHALPARFAGLEAEVTLRPEWDGPEVPLGRFNAAIDRETPRWLVRLVAVAPLPTFLALAAVVGWALPADSTAVFVFPLLAYWGALSSGDIAIASNPQAACEAGEFLAPPVARGEQITTVVVLLTTLLTAVLVTR